MIEWYIWYIYDIYDLNIYIYIYIYIYICVCVCVWSLVLMMVVEEICGGRINKTQFYNFDKSHFFNLMENSVEKRKSYNLFS